MRSLGNLNGTRREWSVYLARRATHLVVLLLRHYWRDQGAEGEVEPKFEIWAPSYSTRLRVSEDPVKLGAGTVPTVLRMSHGEGLVTMARLRRASLDGDAYLFRHASGFFSRGGGSFGCPIFSTRHVHSCGGERKMK